MAKIRTSQMELLRRVKKNDVTYRYDGRGMTFRLWESEYEFTPITTKIKRLMTAGLVTTVAGYNYARGMVVLTDHGRDVMRSQ